MTGRDEEKKDAEATNLAGFIRQFDGARVECMISAFLKEDVADGIGGRLFEGGEEEDSRPTLRCEWGGG